MKRLIAAGILLIIVLTSYLSGYFYIKKTCLKADKMLEECITAYENKKDAEKEADDLKKFWDKKEKPLSFFADHKNIDNLEQAIMTLKVYSATKENELFSEHSQTVKILIHQLLENTVPSIHSVM